MTQRIFKYLKGYSVDPRIIDRLIVSTYLRVNNINVRHNTLLRDYIVVEDDSEEYLWVNKFTSIIVEERQVFDIENLIELFEFVVSPAEKEVNGAVYTPEYIRKYIVENAIDSMSNNELMQTKFADISCGCGGFFYTLTQAIRNRISISYFEIFESNIFGIDIKQYSIDRTKLLLTLLALTDGEDIPDFQFNLYVGNSLNFNWNEIDVIRNNGGFDVILGNPPYVSSSKIDDESKALLSRWSVSKIGKPDLYIPFFQIGIENLRQGGILSYITVNNFYRSLNGRGIRAYLSANNYSLSIIDFNAEQVFRGRSTYTCICSIKKEPTGSIEYVKSKSRDIHNLKKKDFLHIKYSNISDTNGWLLQGESVSKNINKIESTGKLLGKCFEIRNGFATLKNDIFLFTPIKESDVNFYFEKNGIGYWIEKGICRDAIKPNTLKTEGQISDKIEKLIFPYKVARNLFEKEIGSVNIIVEKELKCLYPLAYKYLKDNKSSLNLRDKGNRDYCAWYAFGRSQAINIVGYKLLFPYISDSPYFVYSNQRELLFYNGYALVSDNEKELLIAQKVLSSSIFWYYLENTSKPYGSNYYAFAKNYVKNFGMYQFDEKEKKKLLSMDKKEEIDKYLCDLYGIDI